MAQTYDVSYRINASGNFDIVNKQAISINKNMKEAAAAAGAMPKAAGAALAASGRGARGAAVENREYGAARGAMGATGASGRDFAKQAEGLGGLVRLYATFAANIFAASMAFEALKRSFAFEQLQKASDAFAITTGKNLAGVAFELKKLASGALTDKAAQQMANYGSSAGFTSEQLRRTIGVARGASQALGRDMGDAIDRLMRGMGKLEPELLDELGLLTRTKAAGQEYAKSIGKTFETLTQFEKTQAFVNAVLKEGEEKFGAVSRAVQVSPFEKFSTVLLNVGTSIANVVNKGFVPLMNIFADNPAAMITALGLAFAKLLTTALPSLTKLGDAAKKSAEEQSKAFSAIQNKAAEAQGGILSAERNRIKETMKLRREDSLDLRESILKDLKVRNKLLAEAGGSKSALVSALRKNPNAEIGLEELQKTINRASGNVAAGRNIEANTKLLELAKQQAKVEIEKVNIHEQRLGLVREEIALRNKLRGMESAENIPVGRAFAVQQASLAMKSFKADQLAAIASTAQVYGMTKAWGQLKDTLTTVSTKHKEVYADVGRLSLTNTLSRSFTVAGTAARGLFGILTAGVSNFLSVAGPWIAAIGLVGVAFNYLIDLTDGVNKNLTDLKEKQDAFAGVLKVSGEQAQKFNLLQMSVEGTAESFLKLKNYSSNVFSGITDGLQSTTTAFSKFIAQSDGWWSKITESWNKWWDQTDAVSTQVKQLRSSIYTILATTSAEDSKKVQDAILKALPSATSIDNVLEKISSLSSHQLAAFGTRLAENMANVNIQLKASADNLKSAISGWNSLADAVEKYSDKSEVKDPKLKGIVDALHIINIAYNNATTEKEKALVLSKLDLDTQDKLVKIMQERGIAAQDFVKWLEEGRRKAQDFAEQEQAAAAKRKADQEQSAIDELSRSSLLKSKLERLEQVKAKLASGEGDQRELLNEVSDLQGSILSIFKTSSEKAASIGKTIQAKTIEGLRETLDQVFEEFNASMKEKLKDTKDAAKPHEPEKPKSQEVADSLKRSFTGATDFYPGTNIPIAPVRPKIGDMEAEYYNKVPVKKKTLTPGEVTEKNLKETEKIHKEHEKIAKYLEFEVQEATAYAAQVKRISDIEKETLGFMEEQTAQEQMLADQKVAGANLAKRIAEIDKEYNLSKVKGEKDAEENRKRAINAAMGTFETTKKTTELELLRSKILRENVIFEKLTAEPLKLQLSISNQILDIKKSIGIISDKTYNIAKLENQYAADQLELAKKRNALPNKQKVYMEQHQVTSEVAKQIFDTESNLLSIEEQRLVLGKQINIQIEEYKSKIEDAARIEEIITTNLNLQAESFSILNTQSDRYAQVQQATNAAITVQAAKYLEITKNLTSEKDKQVVLNNSILELENKILEIRRAAYEANARDPRADILKTISEGLDIAYRDAQKKAVGLAKSIVNGISDGISEAVDKLAEAAINGTKFSAKDFAKSIGGSLKKSILEGFASQLKANLLSFFKIEGSQSEAMQLKKQLEETIKSQQSELKAIEDNTKKLEALTTASGNLQQAIENLTSAINGKSVGTGGKQTTPSAKDAHGYEKTIIETGESVSGLSVAAEKGSAAIEDFYGPLEDTTEATIEAAEAAKTFTDILAEGGSFLLNIFGSLGGGLMGLIVKLVGGSGSSNMVGMIKDGLGYLSKGIEIFKSTDFTKMFDFAGWQGTMGMAGESAAIGSTAGTGLGGLEGGISSPGIAPTGAMSGGAGAALSGAGMGFAIGSFAHSMFGNERNGMGMQIGGAIGGAIGNMIVPVIGGIVGSAIGSAIGSLVKSGGGPKTGGFATTNDKLQLTGTDSSGKRWMTPNEQDATAQKLVNEQKQSTNAIIRALGGKTKGATDFAFGFSMDPKGTAKNQIHAGAFVGGKQVYDNAYESGKGEEDLKKSIALETKRATLAVAIASDLPQNVADYFKSLTTEAIKKMSEEEVDTKLDFGAVLGTIHKSRAHIAQVFGEDLYNLTEDDLRKFQQGTEKLSETFNRLYATFTLTDRLVRLFGVDTKKAFKDIGLASVDARQALVDAAGGIEEFGSQLTYFIENFYTAAEQAEITFSTAVTGMQMSFQSLGIEIPKSMSAYKEAIKASIVAGNTELTASLLKLAPAFNSVIGALEAVVKRTDQTIADLLNEIEDMGLDDPQKYEKYAARAETTSASLDTYMAMSNEELLEAIKSGVINPQMLEAMSQGVTDNVKTAIGFIPADERAGYVAEWSTFLAEFGENVGSFTERVNALIATDPTLAAPPTTVDPDAVAPTGVTADTVAGLGGVLDSSFITGAQVVSEGIISGFNTAIGGLASRMFVPPVNEEGNNTMDAVMEVAAKKSNETQQAIFDQQVATLSSLADKLLGAANDFGAASAGLQAAANTQKTVKVDVTINSPIPAEAEISEVNA